MYECISNYEDRNRYDCCVLHVVNISLSDEYKYGLASALQEAMPDNFWDCAKVGDIVENVFETIMLNRSCCIGGFLFDPDYKLYFVVEDIDLTKDDKRNGLKLVNESHETINGKLPKHFYAITKYPIGYFNNTVINTKFYDIVINTQKYHERYFRKIEDVYMPLDKETFGINKLTEQDILEYDIGYIKLYFVICEYNGDKYLFVASDKSRKDCIDNLSDNLYFTFNLLIYKKCGLHETDCLTDPYYQTLNMDRDKLDTLSKITKYLHENEIDFDKAWLLSSLS